MKYAWKSVKSIFVKENKDYLIAEAAGGLTALATATLANVVFSKAGVPDWANMILTYVSQAGASITVNALTYGHIHRKEEDPKGLETKFQSSQLIKVGSKAGVLSGLTKLGLHYGLLKTKIIPFYLAAPIAYALPGLFSSFYRHKKNYENGILCINNGEKKKAANLEGIV